MENIDECEPGDDSYLETSLASPIVDLPISRECLTAEEFIVPTRKKSIEAKLKDIELKQIRKSVEAKTRYSTDELAQYIGRVKAYAQLFKEIELREEFSSSGATTTPNTYKQSFRAPL